MQVMRQEHTVLLKARSVFKEAGYIIERGEREIYSGTVETKVRLFSNGNYTPWFYGQATVLEKNFIMALVSAELVALCFAASAYDIPFSQEPMPLIDSDSDDRSDVGNVSRWDIINSMGATVSDVETAMYMKGVDMSGYIAYKDKLNAQGKRITKEKMASYFFPDGQRATNLKLINLKAPETKKEPEVSHGATRLFTAEY